MVWIGVLSFVFVMFLANLNGEKEEDCEYTAKMIEENKELKRMINHLNRELSLPDQERDDIVTEEVEILQQRLTNTQNRNILLKAEIKSLKKFMKGMENE